MNSKLLGGILLVIGTTIGAGMLALPLATAETGFLGSVILLVSCWLVMTVSAFLFLEVNLSLPANTNIISMAGATLGNGGQAVAWITYLMLLYSILCAYIAGGSDIFHYLLFASHIQTPASASAILFTVILGMVVCFGVRLVDYVNRGLMFGKLGAYFLLVLLILPFISLHQLASVHIEHIGNVTGLTVAAVSFGSLMIIPTLRGYFGEDIKSLRKAVFIGMFIPLICYIAWDMVIMGVIPLDGLHGLKALLHSNNSNSELIATLTSLVNRDVISVLVKFFTSICMATSFLSISLSLSDFLADGFGVAKKGKSGVFIYAATFLPPLLIVLFYPGVFIQALQYAGISCIILMILLPSLMAYRGRYHCDLMQDYQVKGGKILLALLVIFATLLIGQDLLMKAL